MFSVYEKANVDFFSGESKSFGGTVLTRTMDVLANYSIFQELQLVHDTGYFSAMPSLEENWQQTAAQLLSTKSSQGRRGVWLVAGMASANQASFCSATAMGVVAMRDTAMGDAGTGDSAMGDSAMGDAASVMVSQDKLVAGAKPMSSSALVLNGGIHTCLELERYLQTEPKRLSDLFEDDLNCLLSPSFMKAETDEDALDPLLPNLADPPSPPSSLLSPPREPQTLPAPDFPTVVNAAQLSAVTSLTPPSSPELGRHLVKATHTLCASPDGTLTLKLVTRKVAVARAVSPEHIGGHGGGHSDGEQAGTAGGGDSVENKKRVHRCQFNGCRKVYTKSSHLKAHQRTHTADQPTVTEPLHRRPCQPPGAQLTWPPKGWLLWMFLMKGSGEVGIQQFGGQYPAALLRSIHFPVHGVLDLPASPSGIKEGPCHVCGTSLYLQGRRWSTRGALPFHEGTLYNRLQGRDMEGPRCPAVAEQADMGGIAMSPICFPWVVSYGSAQFLVDLLPHLLAVPTPCLHCWLVGHGGIPWI
ncbi:hypothetical protein P4O66_021234 [Electrophorus voltai]|uniref:C2H2-type domain-containing protein n=1 Tax=Electrophorus voltai TaxID=2609070 RepID=A0AAD8ZPT4_9TELE|nr:hypothetical protein P4O66_021234 [Electrophorus voltai]